MDWELLNGITGLISAVCAIISVGYISFHEERPGQAGPEAVLSTRKLASFLVACSGWALCCLSFLWVFEPFGRFPLDAEYRQFYGVILAFPAGVLLNFGLGLLRSDRSDQEPEQEGSAASRKEN
ncbi:hypothetical protein [Alloalcanivorax xenomutans]|uniref:hypothetical protein n=1 Tax=Alloalcanivorax xenomutans TaxID=1094342 RepID=UPI003BAA2147